MGKRDWLIRTYIDHGHIACCASETARMIEMWTRRGMRLFGRPFLLVAPCVAMLGCASFPKEPKDVVEAYRRFLLDTETPFPRRAQEHLGLKTEIDPGMLKIGRFTRLGPEPGNAIYATVTLSRIDKKLNLGRMTTIFDSSVACIKRSDLAALGMAVPGLPPSSTRCQVANPSLPSVVRLQIKSIFRHRAATSTFFFGRLMAIAL